MKKLNRRFRFTRPEEKLGMYQHNKKIIYFFLPNWISLIPPEKKHPDEEYHILYVLIYTDLHEMLHQYIDSEFMDDSYKMDLKFNNNRWKLYDKNKSLIDNWNAYMKFETGSEKIIDYICNSVLDTWQEQEKNNRMLSLLRKYRESYKSLNTYNALDVPIGDNYGTTPA